jgi:hypothetical protein
MIDDRGEALEGKVQEFFLIVRHRHQEKSFLLSCSTNQYSYIVSLDAFLGSISTQVFLFSARNLVI